MSWSSLGDDNEQDEDEDAAVDCDSCGGVDHVQLPEPVRLPDVAVLSATERWWIDFGFRVDIDTRLYFTLQHF